MLVAFIGKALFLFGALVSLYFIREISHKYADNTDTTCIGLFTISMVMLMFNMVSVFGFNYSNACLLVNVFVYIIVNILTVMLTWYYFTKEDSKKETDDADVSENTISEDTTDYSETMTGADTTESSNGNE